MDYPASKIISTDSGFFLKKFKDGNAARECRAALVGSPNTGKTTLFNRLTGMRAKTSNLAGTTVEMREARISLDNIVLDVVDLPGIYGLNATTEEEKVAADFLRDTDDGGLDIIIVVIDACNLERGLFLIHQIIELGLPFAVVLNMWDEAIKRGLEIDVEDLANRLDCPVFTISARKDKGIDKLIGFFEGLASRRKAVSKRLARGFVKSNDLKIACDACSTCPFQSRYMWSDRLAETCVKTPLALTRNMTDKVDKFLTHPALGVLFFAAVMVGFFALIFYIASIPMDLIDALFGYLGSWAGKIIPTGDLQSFVVDALIGGVGGILVFLPQICILFFMLSLLEDSGYLARGAFVLDKLMRRVGLPGTAFVPMLSAHACAIPAIMGTRVISNKRERLLTILVAPLLTCSARLPVYSMVASLLFYDSPTKASLVFVSAYALGILAALGIGFIFSHSILPGKSRPLALELPEYRLPSLSNALILTWDRAMVFVKQAGGIILLVSAVLWLLSTYPKLDEKQLRTSGEMSEAQQAQHAQLALEYSFAGRLGKFIEPVVEPLGFDWRIGVGVLTSFAAREVIVSTLTIVYGIDAKAVVEDELSIHKVLRNAKREDGSLVFSMPTSVSLLVFYVLAMQCLPTQAVVKRETKSWRWPIFQFVYMTILAYVAAFIAYRCASLFT